MPSKKLTDTQIRLLIESMETLGEAEKKEHIKLLKTLSPRQKQEFAAIFAKAKKDLERVEKKFLPKLIELEEEKLKKIKEFTRKTLPKLRKKAETEEKHGESEEMKKLLRKL